MVRVYVLARCLQGLRGALLSSSNQKCAGVRVGISSVQSCCGSCLAKLDGRRHLYPGVRSSIFGCPGVRSARYRRAEVALEFIARPSASAQTLIRAHTAGCGAQHKHTRRSAGAAQPLAQADPLLQPPFGRSRGRWHHPFHGQAPSGYAGSLARTLGFTQLKLAPTPTLHARRSRCHRSLRRGFVRVSCRRSAISDLRKQERQPRPTSHHGFIRSYGSVHLLGHCNLVSSTSAQPINVALHCNARSVTCIACGFLALVPRPSVGSRNPSARRTGMYVVAVRARLLRNLRQVKIGASVRRDGSVSPVRPKTR